MASLILLFFIFTLSQCVLLPENSFALLNPQTQYPCTGLKDGQTFKGSDIFTKLAGDLNRITITGWIFMTGFNDIENTIISVNENNVYLLDLTFNQQTKNYNLFLGGQQFTINDSALASKIWYFFQIHSYKTQVSANTFSINGQFIIHKSNGKISLPNEVTVSSSTMTFDKSTIEFNVGWSKNQLNLSRGCSFMKNIYLFWNDLIEITDVFGLIGDPSVGIHNFMQRIDFELHINNPGFVYNLVGNQDKIELNYNHYNPSLLKSEEYLSLNTMSYFIKGFTLSFYFKMQEKPLFENTILQINSFEQTMKIVIDSNNLISQTIILSSSSQITYSIDIIQENQWCQVIMIVQQNFFTHGNIILKQLALNTIFPFDLFQTYFKYIQIDFGSKISHQILQIANINIYSGTQIVENQFCQYQMSLISGNQCLLCKANYIIDYQNTHQCVYDNNNNQLIPGLKDWNPPHLQCPEGMILDTTLNQCICRNQHYLKDKKCYLCPKYCNGCTDETTCIEGGSGRINGVCPSDTFDDGFNCLRDFSYEIPNKINTVFYHNSANLDFDPSCLYNVANSQFIFDSNNALDLKDNDSFYFSFSMKYKSQNIITESIIGYFKNNAQIVFLIKFISQSDLKYVQILNQNSQALISIRFHPSSGFWMGIWTDLSTAMITLVTNGYFYIQQIEIGSNPIYNQPKLCIGPCQAASLPYFCGLFTSLPILIIKNMKLPNNEQGISFLQNLPYTQTNIASYFIYSPEDPQSLLKSINLINQSYEFTFNSGNILHREIKGFATHQTFSSTILKSQNAPLTFSCSIYIEQIKKTVTFLEFDFGEVLRIYFVPSESLQSSFLQICYEIECYQTQICRVDHQKITFLLIKYNQKCISCTSQRQEEFEVVINYCRETILFLKSYNNNSFSQIQIGNGNNSLEPFLVYFNYFKIYSPNGYFYFSYNISDHCFIYLNLGNLWCLQPKEGYYLLGNQVVSKQECYQISLDGDFLFATNEFSRECINTQLSSDLCVQYDLLSLECTQCRGANNEPTSFCTTCKDGYFFDKQTNICKACDYKCSQCEESYDNCTVCRYENSQSPPTCNCESFQFLNNQQQCIYCSSKCLSCQDSEKNCLQCAEKRINPPNCECDTEYYLLNDNCDDIICSNSCQICNQNECIKCKNGRIDPPSCVCETNYYPTSNGECSPCNSDQFFDKETQMCNKCARPCSKCVESKTNCLECESDYILSDNKCYCSSGKIIFSEQEQDLKCTQNMEVELQIQFRENQYHLEFTFEQNIKQIDFTQYNVNEIFSFYLFQIPQSFYYLSNVMIEGNKLTTLVVIKQSFSVTTGSVQIKQPQLFISTSEKYALNPDYLNKLFTFKIGPIILKQSDLEVKELDQFLTSIKNSNQNVISLIQQFQLVFYFLNTLQPTVMILLYNAQLPPNLYKLCQLYGMFVYPDVPDYQTQNYKSSFSILGYQLNSTEIKQSKINKLSQLGFSNSFLINTQITIIKQLFLLISLLLLSFVGEISTKIKNLRFGQKKILKQFRMKIINQILSENETNLLMLFLSVMAQFYENQQEQWAFRYGIYISFLQIAFLFIQINYIFDILRNRENKQQGKIELFTSRLANNNNQRLSKYYFLIQLIKKYLIILIIVIFYDYPFFVGISVSATFLISSIQTQYQQPYQSKRTRMIKIIGELIMSMVWLLLLTVKEIEKRLFNQIIFDQDNIDFYLKIGNIAIVLLLLFNILYFLELLASIAIKLSQQINIKKKQQKQPFKQQDYYNRKLIIK